jgi:hypothetical protein
VFAEVYGLLPRTIRNARHPIAIRIRPSAVREHRSRGNLAIAGISGTMAWDDAMNGASFPGATISSVEGPPA